MFFYQNSRLALIRFGAVQRRIAEASTQLLSVMQAETQASLLATDFKASVLWGQRQSTIPCHYSPYGWQAPQPWMPGFTGQVQEAITEGYLLGNGYRLYSPKLMRFYSADSWSPFGKGGINTYSYCACDPVNSTDPSGHIRSWSFLKGIVQKKLKMTKYQGESAAWHAAEVERRIGGNNRRPDESNLRRVFDEEFNISYAHIESAEQKLKTLSAVPENEALRAQAKASLEKHRALVKLTINADLDAQKKIYLEPSAVYTHKILESGVILVRKVDVVRASS